MAEGETGGEEIPAFEKGDATRTPMHADAINEIVDAVNALMQMVVIPKGRLLWSDANAVLDLTDAGGGCGDTEPAAEGTFVCGSVDGVKQWIETSDCSDGTIDGGGSI